MMTFRDKLILITGASSGIGAQTALDFAAQGARLILVARRHERLMELAETIQRSGAQAEVHPCDLSHPEARRRLIEELHKRRLIPDVLINNAGYGNYRPFLEETPAEIERMMEVNYQAAAHLLSAFLPEMIKRGSGAVVNVASGAGKVAVPYMASYCATKFALCALTEAVAAELQGTGITLHLVNPGPVDTEFFEAGIWQGPRQQKKSSARQVSQALQRAIIKNRLISYVPPLRGVLVYMFHVLGPLGRWILRRRARLD